ncbi:UNVERIFIED_CONTAM: hypothetical protein DES50_11179 [Williamsia faeni]
MLVSADRFEEFTLVDVVSPSRWRTLGQGVWCYLRSAPWTFSWLLLLLITTTIQHSVSRATLESLLAARSTNLHHLATDPLHVLVSSLFWIDGYVWLPYLLMFCVFHAPAERWLGAWRWAVVGLTAHVVATYISEGLLWIAIRQGLADSSLVDARDIGVSYFLAAIVGVLTYHIAFPWRWVYLFLILAWFGVPVMIDPGLTGIGHLSSMIIGLAFYPLARGRDRPEWNPAALYLRVRGAVSKRASNDIA